YTSLTTAAGFASLALTPIPPIQVFGLFVAFGVMLAWLWTVTFIPAFVMLVPEKSLENFGLTRKEVDTTARSPLSRFLPGLGRLTHHHAKLVMVITVVLTVVAVYGIRQIQINDNPIKWFEPSHPIRVADKVLNDHFGGTYMAYLLLEAPETIEDPAHYAEAVATRMAARAEDLKEMVPTAASVFEALRAEATRLGAATLSKESLLDELESFTDSRIEVAPEEELEAWEEALLFIDEERERDQVFKQPDALIYMSGLQDHLLRSGVVGKSNSLADVVKTVHRELLLGEPEQFKIPESAGAVAQCLITYQNSHRPHDLWHFVTPDYKKASLWVQLRSGDNRDMSKVVEAVDDYVAASPPPLNLQHRWFGLTYINVIWQDKMVTGMLHAFMGSFLVVLLMMTLLFRSALWGVLSMVPLTVTIGLVYGTIGLVGKDYDMPVAVLSSLSLGLAVDYAIHFLSRSRTLRESHGTWAATLAPVFEEPSRAIARNVV
ncbi:MAG: MMPL family transporter, partial [Candidatus Hydrogenedentota bacterium]